MLVFSWEFLHQHSKKLWFYFLVVFLSGAGVRVTVALRIRRCCLLFSVLENFDKGLCLFFKCLLGLTSEDIRSRTFIFQNIFDYWLNLLTSYRSIWVFYFFVIHLHRFCVCRNSSISSRLYSLLTQLLTVHSYSPFYFCRIFVSKFSNLSHVFFFLSQYS